jgi:hypothetical protein
MNLEGACADVEELLKCFLVGTHSATLADQIRDIRQLPLALRERVRAAQTLGRTWAAWSTEHGPFVAWADYDVDGSKRLHAHLLYIEWYTPSGNYHAAWCHCDPRRHCEWTFGRGGLEDRH